MRNAEECLLFAGILPDTQKHFCEFFEEGLRQLSWLWLFPVALKLGSFGTLLSKCLEKKKNAKNYFSLSYSTDFDKIGVCEMETIFLFFEKI